MENIDKKYLIEKIQNEIELISNNENEIFQKNLYLNLIKFLKEKISLIDKKYIKINNYINFDINIFNYFDCVYIINSINERYKIKNLHNLFKKNKSNIKVINKEIKNKDNIHIYNNFELNKLENNNFFIKSEIEISNLISHLNCLKDMKYYNYKKILILEDNVNINNNFNNIFKDIINNINNYDILFLGNLQSNWENINLNDNNFYKSNSYSSGFFSYSITNNILDILINYYENFDKPIDYCLKQIILDNDNSYCVYPNIFLINKNIEN